MLNVDGKENGNTNRQQVSNWLKNNNNFARAAHIFVHFFAVVLHDNNMKLPSQASSTRIQIFLNPQLFLSGFKTFHVHTHPYSNRICPSTTTVPRTPLRILATDHASKGAQNLHLSLPCVTDLYFIVRVIAESVQKSKKMRRAMLTPLSGRVRERAWKRGCRLEYSIQYFLTAAIKFPCFSSKEIRLLYFLSLALVLSLFHVSVDTNIQSKKDLALLLFLSLRVAMQFTANPQLLEIRNFTRLK